MLDLTCDAAHDCTARKRAIDLNVLDKLPAALKGHAYVVANALRFVEVMLESETGASTLAQVDGLIETLARLVLLDRTKDERNNVETAGTQLIEIVKKQPDEKSTARVRNLVADVVFEPLLRRKPDSDLLKALALSEVGLESARRALECVLNRCDVNFNEYLLLSGSLQEGYHQIRGQYEELSKFFMSMLQRDLEALERIQHTHRFLLLESNGDENAVFQFLRSGVGISPLVALLDDAENGIHAALMCSCIARYPVALKGLMAAQVTSGAMMLLRVTLFHASKSSNTVSLISTLLATASDLSSDEYQQVVKGVLEHDVFAMVTDELKHSQVSRRIVTDLLQSVKDGSANDFWRIANAIMSTRGFEVLLASLKLDPCLGDEISSAVSCASSLLRAADHAGGDAFLQVAEALTKTHNVVALLLTQIQADPMLERAATSSCCGVLAHLARIDAGASALRQLISSRSVVALRKVLSTTHHVRAAALKSCGLLTALSGWLADVGDRPLTERVATLGLVRDLASAPDVPTEQYLLPLLRLIVPLLEAVATADGDGATELDALEVMHLTSALSSAKEGMRELHKAKVLPMLVRLMRAGDLAGDGTYIKECVALLHNALADTSSAADAALVVTEVVELLPADSTFDPFDVADARFAMRVLTKLVPYGARSFHARATTAVLDAGGMRRVLAAMDGDEWMVLREFAHVSAELFSGMCGASKEAMAMAHDEHSALGFILKQMALCKRGEVDSYLQILIEYSLSPEHKYRDALLKAGMLDTMASFLNAGPEAHGYFYCTCIIQLLCLYGTSEHCAKVRSSDALKTMLECRAEGRIRDESVKVRTEQLAAIFASLPAAEKILTRAVLQLGNKAKETEALVTLRTFCEKVEGLHALVESDVVPRLVDLLSSKRKDNHGLALICLGKIANANPKRVAPSATVCATLVYESLEKLKQVDYFCAYAIGAVADASSKAKATIRTLVSRIFEEEDSGSEAHAEKVVGSLLGMCASPPGARVAYKAGIVAEAMQALTGAQGVTLRLNALQLLRGVAEWNEGARASMRDGNLVDTLVRLITLSWHVPPRVVTSVEGNEATTVEPHLSYTYSAYLSHDWGIDELDRNNHERVKMAYEALEREGLASFLVDGATRERLDDQQVSDAIVKSAVVVVFLTESYMKNACGRGPKGDDDHCKFEFTLSCSPHRKGVAKIIPVVMEPRCLSISQWQPLFEGKLGGKMYFNLSRDNDEAPDGERHFDKEIARLASAIKQVPGALISSASAGEQGTSQAHGDATSESERDPRVGDAALSLLGTLAEADSLRQAIQSAKPLDALQYIYEHGNEQDSEHKCKTDALLVIGNVYSETLDFDAETTHGSAGNESESTRVRRLLRDGGVEAELIGRLNEGLQNLVNGFSGPKEIRRWMACVRNLAADRHLRHSLVEKGVGNLLARVLVEGPKAVDPVTDADMTLAAEALQRCALGADRAEHKKDVQAARAKLEEDGVKIALETAITGTREDNEGTMRRRQAAKQALDALNSKLDLTTTGGKANWQKARKARDADWDDDQLLKDVPRFNCFISHKRTSAQDFARGLHSLLVGKGYTAFLDVENLEQLADLPLVVAGCDVFIFVLSDGIFESEYCLKELKSAVLAGMSVILVTKEGSRWPDQDGENVDSFPGAHLIDWLPPECREPFRSNVAISHSNEYYTSFCHNLVGRVKRLVDEKRKEHGGEALTDQPSVPPDALVLAQRRQLLDARERQASKLAEASLDVPFWFVDADRIRKSDYVTLPRMQELRADGWLVHHRWSFDKACRGEYAKEFLAISHRWEDKNAPDEGGVQFSAVRTFLGDTENGGSAIKWVWFE